MLAFFIPDRTLTLAEAASAFGYDHFNWINVFNSYVTHGPADTPVDWNNQPVQLPAIDPPYAPCSSGGFSGWSYGPADCGIPYYWNESQGPWAADTTLDYPGDQNQPPTTTLKSTLFHDSPTVSIGRIDHKDFTTALVGAIDPEGTFVTGGEPLAEFAWSSNYGPLGGGSIQGYTLNDNPAEIDIPDSQGGIFNAYTVDLSDLPLSTRQVFSQAGLQGVPLTPTVMSVPPMTASFVNGPQGTNGWYVGPVNVTLVATDIYGPSAIASTSYQVDGGTALSYSEAFAISTDGTHTLQYDSVDSGGNSEQPKLTSIMIDQTPPTISGSAVPSPNAYGWNNTPVTVSFQCADATSGLASGSPPSPTVVSAQGAAQSVTATCADLAGNSATATVGGISIDNTPPAIVVTVPANGATYSANQVVNASYNCSDSLSGIASCAGTVPNNGTLDTSSGGAKTFSVNAIDLAGNSVTQTVNYTVASACHYVALGFGSSTVTRGATDTFTGSVSSCSTTSQKVSVKFSLTGSLGPKACATSTTVMFTSPTFTIAPGTSGKISFPFIVPSAACTGSYTVTATTLIGGVPVDSSSASLTVK
jgi:hypothetical protein